MRLIDADALIEQMEEDMEHMEEPLAKMFTGAAISDIKHAPTVEPERKTGHWVKSDMQRWYDVWMCSECGEKTDSAVMSEPRYKYCPMCGADMRGDNHVN